MFVKISYFIDSYHLRIFSSREGHPHVLRWFFVIIASIINIVWLKNVNWHVCHLYENDSVNSENVLFPLGWCVHPSSSIIFTARWNRLAFIWDARDWTISSSILDMINLSFSRENDAVLFPFTYLIW
jgi:hypothetical protein